jgi:siroheme synthase-like protein
VSAYPLVLEGDRIRALVVGGGAVAHRKVVALLDSGATVRVVAPVAGSALRALAGHGRLTLVEREYRADDIGDATLVIAATNVRAVNARVAADARARSRLVNVVDAPAEGDWMTVAAHHAGPLTIGVSAGGLPAAASHIRDAIADRFDDRYAAAVTGLVTLRRRLLDDGGSDVWREAKRALIGPDFCDVVENGGLAPRLAAWR